MNRLTTKINTWSNHARSKLEQTSEHRLFFHFPIRDQIIFAKRLAMILRSGLPILYGLRMLQEEAHSRSAAHIARVVADNVEDGQTLSTSLSEFNSVIGDFFISLVRVGEASGTLADNLEYIAQELKKKHELRRQVIGALMYPVIIVLATTAITILLMVYIFPKIIPVFISLKVSLPLSTQILITVSNFLLQHGVWILVGTVLLGITYVFLLRVQSFRLLTDRALLRLPILGNVSRYYNLANMCRTLSLLLKSDVRVITALDITRDSLQNSAYQEAIGKINTSVQSGQRISTQLKTFPHLFPPITVQMVSAGEQTGNLSDTLMYLSDMYEGEIHDWTKNLTSMLEPILMLTMGFMVGFIAISVITPIYGITQNLTQ